MIRFTGRSMVFWDVRRKAAQSNGLLRDSAGARPSPRSGGSRRRLCISLVALLVIVVPFSVVTGRVFIWPDLAEVPASADAIIELGGMGDRDGAALALAREHRAPVLIQSTVVAEAGTEQMPATDP